MTDTQGVEYLDVRALGGQGDQVAALDLRVATDTKVSEVGLLWFTS